MAIRFTTEFATIKDRKVTVNIYDGNYGGTPVGLEPALSTITIDMVSGSLHEPVRTTTGYLRVINNQDLADVAPMALTERPVEVIVDNTLYWRGYITPSTYTSPLSNLESKEFPLTSALSVLSSIPSATEVSTLQPIAWYLKNCLEATGYSWNTIVLPIQMTSINGKSINLAELRCMVCAHNFATVSSLLDSDPDYKVLEGNNYLNILTTICQYFGWQAVEHGDNLYLLSNRYECTEYLSITYGQLSELAVDANATIQPIAVQATTILDDMLNYDGIDHSISITPGKRKVTVSAKATITTDISPTIDFSGATTYREAGGSFAGNALYSNIAIAPKSTIKLHKWNRNADGTWNEVAYKAPTTLDELNAALTAHLVRNDTRPTSPLPTNYNYSNYLRLNRRATPVVKLATLTSAKGGAFAKGGALCLSLSAYSSYTRTETSSTVFIYDEYGRTAWGPGNCMLNLSVGIGNHWWNGSAWATIAEGAEPPIFQLYVGHKDYDWNNAPQQIGNITNTKVLSDEYNGFDGYIMRLDNTLSGVAKIIVYNYSYPNGIPAKYEPASLYLSNITLGYYSNKYDDNTNDIVISALTGVEYTQDLNVTLNMSSVDATKPGIGTVYYDGEALSSKNLPGYAEGNQLPEQYLLHSLTKMVATPQTLLQLIVEPLNHLPIDRVLYDGNTYLIAGEQIDLQDESSTLTLVHYGEV